MNTIQGNDITIIQVERLILHVENVTIPSEKPATTHSDCVPIIKRGLRILLIICLLLAGSHIMPVALHLALLHLLPELLDFFLESLPQKHIAS